MWHFYLVAAFLMAFVASLTNGRTTSAGGAQAVLRNPVEKPCGMCMNQGGFYYDHRTLNDALSDWIFLHDKHDRISMEELDYDVPLVKVSPYKVANPVNPRKVENRSSIWIESGFWANDSMNIHVTLNMIEKLALDCKQHCLYDYYILPVINSLGFDSSFVMPDHILTYEMNEPSLLCSGYDLLHHFPGRMENGDWDWEENAKYCTGFDGGLISKAVNYVTTVKADDETHMAATFVLTQDARTAGSAAAIRYPYIGDPKASKPNAFDYEDVVKAYESVLQDKTYSDNRKFVFHGDGKSNPDEWKGHPVNFYDHIYKDNANFNIAIYSDSVYARDPYYVEENTQIYMDAINAIITSFEDMGKVFKVE